MPIRICQEPKCGSEATYRGRCRRHARGRERETHRNKSFYATAKWRNTREAVLFESPLCSCGAIATDVHHKVDLAAGGDPWNRDNLEALCHACHAQITRARQ